MQFDEGSLRDVLGTTLGPHVPELMLDALEGGVVMEVTLKGQTHHITDPKAAMALLNETIERAPARIIRGLDGYAPSRGGV